MGMNLFLWLVDSINNYFKSLCTRVRNELYTKCPSLINTNKDLKVSPGQCKAGHLGPTTAHYLTFMVAKQSRDFTCNSDSFNKLKPPNLNAVGGQLT